MSDPFVGEIKLVGFDFAPRGYVFSQGQTLPINQNNALYALLGTRFGGDGVNTFGVPDYRGRVPVGMGQGPGLAVYTQGQKAGTESTTLVVANLPAHNHPANTTLAGGLTATTTINALTQPTARQPSPSGALLTGAQDSVTLAPVNGYALPGNGTAATLATGAATTTIASTLAAATTVGNTGGGTAISNLQPFLGTNYIIATTGIFPSRN